MSRMLPRTENPCGIVNFVRWIQNFLGGAVMENASHSYPQARRSARMPLTLAIAIVVGVIAAVKFDSIKTLFARATSATPARRAAGPNDAVVPIVATKIQPGTMITSHMLTKGIVPKRALDNDE